MYSALSCSVRKSPSYGIFDIKDGEKRMQQEPNPQRAQPGWPAVVVAGLYQTGVNLMRDLTRRGLTVYGIDFTLDEPGFRSIYGKAFECPNPDDHPDKWLDFLVNLGKKLGNKPVLIASADTFVSAIAQHTEELRSEFRFCYAAATAQGLLATKQRQYDLAAEHGLGVPRTRFIKSYEEAIEFSSTGRFPFLIKPIHFREWERFPRGHPLRNRKTAIVISPEELKKTYQMLVQGSPQVVIQEIIEGPDTAKLVYLSCYSVDGRRIGVCIVRELRTTPIYFGSASVVEPVTDLDSDSGCDRFLKGIGYSGICEIELKRDSRDGRVKMIEANPRYSVTADAAVYGGVDLGWLHYLDLIGQHVVPVNQRASSFRHIVLTRDITTIRSYRRAGLLTWRSLIRSYLPPVFFFDFDIWDWRVTAETIFTIIRQIVGPPIRRVFPKKHV